MPYSDEKAAEAIRFFERVLVHCDGEWAGQPFILMDWQREMISKLFGTLRDDGTRQWVVVIRSGDGYGDGSGSGDGSGYGSGYGYGDGSGDGSGYGYGDGSGSGDGYGYGDGDGDGDGSGDGSGYGYGDGDG